MVQAHIIFTGTVQGVGFRFTVQRHALSFELRGWVKNLPNGSVEVLVEGPKERIEAFCRNIESNFEGYIRNKNIQFVPAQDNFKIFQITF